MVFSRTPMARKVPLCWHARAAASACPNATCSANDSSQPARPAQDLRNCSRSGREVPAPKCRAARGQRRPFSGRSSRDPGTERSVSSQGAAEKSTQEALANASGRSVASSDADQDTQPSFSKKCRRCQRTQAPCVCFDSQPANDAGASGRRITNFLRRRSRRHLGRGCRHCTHGRGKCHRHRHCPQGYRVRLRAVAWRWGARHQQGTR
mmetsp:Transcript_152838/g.490263  ORF Transcript_152838/g.490263 Transcript_152838/m.490263 type:complete len:208 (+) Transcript_152838:280-903(+)